MPTAFWVLVRRLRYAYAAAAGSNRIAGEKICVSWKRDWDFVRAIKRVCSNPPRRKSVNAEGELWKTPVGDFWTPVGVAEYFMIMLTAEVLCDIYEFAAQSWSRPPIVLDCGANIGMFLACALKLGAEQVVCCEPSPPSARCLELTFAAEIVARRMTVVKKALWDKPEALQFSTSCKRNPGTHRVSTTNAPENITVEATTIDCIVHDLGLPRVDFIKMDIEGAEVNALRRAAATIRRFHPMISVGTEHTNDIAANNESVITTIRGIDPSYRVRCTEVHPERSPSSGLVLTPYSMVFY